MKPNVPIGPSTVAGYSVTVTGVILAILAYLDGDHSQQTVGMLVAGAIAILSFLVTQAGRYAQAKVLAAKPEAVPAVANLATFIGSGDDAEPELVDRIDQDADDLPTYDNPPEDQGDIEETI